MKDITKKALFLALILPINFIGVQVDYSRASFVGEIKDTAEEVSLPVVSEISDISGIEKESKEISVTTNSSEDVGQNDEVVSEMSNDSRDGGDRQSSKISSRDDDSKSKISSGTKGVCIGDLNFDGFVNQGDIDVVLAEWSSGENSVDFSVADLNNDGSVDGSDLGTVLGQWGPCEGTNGPTCFADLNNDGNVDQGDLDIVLAEWSPAPNSVKSSPTDLDNDGSINGSDLGIVLGQWGSCFDSLTNSESVAVDPILFRNSNIRPSFDVSPKGDVVITIPSSPLSPTDIGNTIDDEPKSDEPVDPTDPVDPNDNNGGNSGGGSSKNKKKGEVLGASTVDLQIPISFGCDEPYLKEYIKFGANNNPEEVKKLQSFLNKPTINRGVVVPVDGVYGENTLAAVKDFQLRFNKLILKPWTDAGFMPTDTEPTGYVYQTTRYWINVMHCGGIKSLSQPVLRLGVAA